MGEEMEESDHDNKLNVKGSADSKMGKHLEHPNIIKYYDSFVEGDCLYIVMELHKGHSL